MRRLDPPVAEVFAQAMAAALAGDEAARIGIAVSGGGDSTALLHLARDWAAARGRVLEAATVDHGLRAGAAAEARAVAALCARLEIRHATLLWRDRPTGGNLQDAARRARYGLLGGWAQDRGLAAVATGHTRDDQAETFLMRLARGSGVDGLAAIAARREDGDGRVWLRPLIGVSRQTLRDFLSGRGESWSEDPSNDDPRFDRVRARRLLESGETGLEPRRLAATAARMGRARRALERVTLDHAHALAAVNAAGDVEFALAGFRALEAEFRFRLLAHAVRWVATAPYRPRASTIEPLLAAPDDLRPVTLGGCLVSVAGETLRIGREPGAVRGTTAPPGALWDGRWRAEGPDAGAEVTIAALGEAGLAACPDWRGAGLPRASLAASPAVFSGERLIAAPLAGMKNGWSCRLDRGKGHFFTSVLSH